MKLNNFYVIFFSVLLLNHCSYKEYNVNGLGFDLINWSNVGRSKIKNNLNTSENTIFVVPPTFDTKENHKNISKAIQRASKNKGMTYIILGDGRYEIDESIVLRSNIDSIVIKGSKNSEIHYIGHSQKPSTIFKVYGFSPNWTESIKLVHYDDDLKKIKLNKKIEDINIGDFIEIRLKNGEWHDSENHKSWNPQNYLGTIVKIIEIDERFNEYKLNMSILTEWKMLESFKSEAQVLQFNPVKEIGFENFQISTNNVNNRQGVNIDFFYAANCWVKSIESSYAASTHISISNSTNIEVLNSTMHHAKDYGNPAVPEENLVAGTGYGVNIARSSNCLIENNTFYHLRHAMIIALGSNRNVFGYNHSYDQYSFPVKNLSDLNLHGHYPYNNLFEGNIVDRIHADQWWGSNGPNNTFVGNIVKKGTIKLEKTNNTNLSNNIAEIELIQSSVNIDSVKIDLLEEPTLNDSTKLSAIRKRSLYKNNNQILK